MRVSPLLVLVFVSGRGNVSPTKGLRAVGLLGRLI